ncbi:hypothetical protein L1887_32236 [Cichorium endivia]|nr:hypothetical protein L1887_32236 [Cichorium endivia]
MVMSTAAITGEEVRARVERVRLMGERNLEKVVRVWVRYTQTKPETPILNLSFKEIAREIVCSKRLHV